MVLPTASTLNEAPGADEALQNAQSVVREATIQVGALIEGVCCRSGDWVDWERYRPHFLLHFGPDEGQVSAVSLALPEDGRGLRAGGFIEMHLLPKERTVEANGGYYDEYRQPRLVIEGSLSWQELTYQHLGQTLLLMYHRILKACGERSAGSDEADDADGKREDRAGMAGRNEAE